MDIYQGLWLSADFECELEMEFPSQFRALKWNENQISNDDLKSMHNFWKEHPVFNQILKKFYNNFYEIKKPLDK